MLSRITYDSEQVNAASGALINIVREGASIIGLMVLMFYNSWQLSAILLIVVPIVAMPLNWSLFVFVTSQPICKMLWGVSPLQLSKCSKVTKKFELWRSEIEEKRFFTVSNQMRQQGMKLNSAQAIANLVIQLIASFALVAVLVIASEESVRTELTAGTFAVVFGAMFGDATFESATNVTGQFQRGMAACNSLFI